MQDNVEFEMMVMSEGGTMKSFHGVEATEHINLQLPV